MNDLQKLQRDPSYNPLVGWWAKNSVAANLLMVSCLLIGVMNIFGIEKRIFPSIELEAVQARIIWPGAAPVEVEDQIILRVEEVTTDVPSLKDVYATAREGFASITFIMDEGGNFSEFLNEIKGRVDGINTLPDDAEPPVVGRLNADETMLWLGLGGKVSMRELNRLGREIRAELAALDGGSALVELYGERREEVSIEVSETALRQYGLTFDDIARAVGADSVNLSSGQVRTNTGTVQLSVRNRAETQADFERIIVRQNRDGSHITVGDVAKVIDGFEDVRQQTELNGNPSVSFGVNAPKEMNIVALSKVIHDYVDKKNTQLPPGTELIITFDGADMFSGRMQLVSSNAIIGLILVLITLMLFLQPAVAFWTAIGIAISFIGAFIFLPMAGVSLNMLSMFGFLLVIGIVVDDAIVVGESIYSQIEKGRSGLTAAILGTQLVAKPVFFAVVTTMLAFAPFIFLSGQMAVFTRQIAVTIFFVLMFSLIEAFLILPAHLSHLKTARTDTIFSRFQSIFTGLLQSVCLYAYRPLLAFAIKFRYVTVAFFIMSFILATSLIVQSWVKFKFMPNAENDFMAVSFTAQEGTPFSRMEQIRNQFSDALAQVRTSIKNDTGVDPIGDVFLEIEETSMFAFLTALPADDRSMTLEDMGKLIRTELGHIPDTQSMDFITSFAGNNNSADIQFVVTAPTINELNAVSSDIRQFLLSSSGVFGVQSSMKSSQEEIQLDLKPGAARFGVTLGDAARQVRQAYYGQEVQRLPRDGQDVRVMVRYPSDARNDLSSLENFRLRVAGGRELPLSAIADTRYAPNFTEIRRENRQRVNKISASVAKGYNSGLITREFYSTEVPKLEKEYPNVTFRKGGASREEAEFMMKLGRLFIVTFLGMYALLAIAFNSYWQPILILSSIPFAFMGAVFGHALLGENFAMFSIFGIGAAAGVVINDNLVLVDYINRLRAAGAGALSALMEAGVSRFRPIILTTLTTFIGLAPILFERSFDAQFLRPTIIAVSFGVLFALFVTLLFVPCLYAVGVDLRRIFAGKKAVPLGQGASQFEEVPDIDGIKFPAE